MTKKIFLRLVAFIAICATLAACNATTTPVVPPSNSAAFNQSALTAVLNAKNFKVEMTGEIEQPFFKVKGASLRVSGGNLTKPVDLMAFNYANAKSASDDASQIEPSGNPRTMRISWIEPPHFFRKDRVIVVYLGSDASALAMLNEILGAQFAGK